MKGSLLWNLSAAVFGFFLVFFISVQVTTLETAVLRGAVVFFIFFGLSYAFRGVVSFITRPEGKLHVKGTSSMSQNQKQSNSFEGISAEETSKMVRELLNENG